MYLKNRYAEFDQCADAGFDWKLGPWARTSCPERLDQIDLHRAQVAAEFLPIWDVVLLFEGT